MRPLKWRPSPGHAQGKCPDHPVKVVVGFSASGGTDVAARVIAQKLSEAMGQTFAIENRMSAVENQRIQPALRMSRFDTH